MGRRKKMTDEKEGGRDYVQAPVTVEPGIRCIHCKRVGYKHAVTNVYPNGNRRRVCEYCGLPFVTSREKDL